MHMPGKYRDLVFGIAGEEIGHVEMLATMIAQLLEKRAAILETIRGVQHGLAAVPVGFQ
jgi:Mn-containing catalase